MSISAPTNTVEYHSTARPLTVHRSLYDHNIKEVGQMMMRNKEYGPCKDEVYPEADAVTFYLLNHAVAELSAKVHPKQPLGDEVEILKLYHSLAAPIMMRCFYYLLVICVRESRHLKNHGSLVGTMTDKWGAKAASYMNTIEDSPYTAMNQIMESGPENVKLGDLVECMRWAFYHGNYGGGGFGGKKWGVVCDALCNFVDGTYSGEMMLDTVWTLCHNGGPIFNKGMFYKCYSTQALRTILDVQRAGQIPQLVLDTSSRGLTGIYSHHINKSHTELHKMTAQHLPHGDFAGNKVDWEKVMSLGALGSYTGMLPKGAKAVASEYPKPKKAINKFTLTPNVELVITGRTKEG